MTRPDVRFDLEPWPSDAGGGIAEPEPELPSGPVDLDAEVAAADWAPRDPGADPAGSVLFVDGVLRPDGRLWITRGDGRTGLGACASYAAGAVRCGARATLERVEVRRGLFALAGTPDIETPVGTYALRPVGSDDRDHLRQGTIERMRRLEGEVAAACDPADLLLLDGPLQGHPGSPTAVGYVKTHHVAYLPSTLVDAVVARLAPGQRTPLFLVQTGSRSRYSWYLKLPGAGGGHPYAGVARCEVLADDVDDRQAAELADRTTATLPRFASRAHKDGRAPVNLYPIAGLERRLRHRLGDPAVVFRALRSAT